MTDRNINDVAWCHQHQGRPGDCFPNHNPTSAWRDGTEPPLEHDHWAGMGPPVILGEVLDPDTVAVLAASPHQNGSSP